jgi:hypothetical protein
MPFSDIMLGMPESGNSCPEIVKSARHQVRGGCFGECVEARALTGSAHNLVGYCVPRVKVTGASSTDVIFPLKPAPSYSSSKLSG